MPNRITVKRGTRAQLEAAATAGTINAGEPYLIIDEGRFALGTSTSAYQDFAKASEAGGGPAVISYDDRATLRAVNGPATTLAILDKLGVFIWEAGSTELDDDETCFASSGGRWLLQSAAWDLVNEYWASDIDALNTATDSLEASVATINTNLKAKLLRASFTFSVTSIAANTGASTTVTVQGAMFNDFVSVSPPSTISAGTVVTGTVTAPNVVTLRFWAANPAGINPTGIYQILVIRGKF